MYAGIGRTNSSNANSNPIESGAEIPEWKRLLIMRKRAGALAATTTSDETNAKTAVSAEPVCSHFPNPVVSGRHGNLSGNCNVITGCCDSDLPSGLHTHGKFSPMLPSSASITLAAVESDRYNLSESTAQDTVVRTIGNITVELRTVHNRSVLENGDDSGAGVLSSPNADRFPLMSPSSSEPAYLVEEELANEEPPEEESEDLQYGPGIVDKLRARFLNLGRKNRRRPVVRKFSSLENLSPGGYGTIRATGPCNKLPKGEYRRSGIRATNFSHQHGLNSNFKKAQSMETLLVGSTTGAVSPSSIPDSNFMPLRRSRLFIKSLSHGYTSKYASEKTTITSPRSYQDAKKRFEYSRQTSSSSINEAELPKPDTVKQFKKIFESPVPPTANSKDGRPCLAVANHISNEKQNPIRTSVIGTPTCSASKTLPPFNAIAMSGNIRPRKVSPANSSIANAASSIILEEEVLISTDDESAKVPKDVFDPQGPSTLANGSEVVYDKTKRGGSPPRTPELTNETSLISKWENDDDYISTSLSVFRTNKSPCLDETESSSAKSSDVIVSDSFSLPYSPTDSESYYDSAKVTSSASAERLPTIEQNSDCCEEKKEQASQGSQVTTEPEQDSHVTSVIRKKPHLHQPDSSALVGNIDDSPTGEGDYQYDQVCEDDDEQDMVVASTSQIEAPPHHLRTRENDAAVANQPNNLLIFNKKPSNWQKPPQPTTSVVFDFRGKDVKPNISLNPTPFGCKPAKVKKRTGSPPRGDAKVLNGITNNDYQLSPDVEDDEDEEDWDEMDIGADLPAMSGISFDGENVKVGRGALLETRNKKLTIQFNDDATATYEYPCESPIEDYATDDSTSTAIKSSSAIGSYAANSSLSNYTPYVLGNNDDFQLGVSRTPTHRPPPPLPIRSEPPVLASASEVVIPADPEDTSGWSATETTDILF